VCKNDAPAFRESSFDGSFDRLSRPRVLCCVVSYSVVCCVLFCGRRCPSVAEIVAER